MDVCDDQPRTLCKITFRRRGIPESGIVKYAKNLRASPSIIGGTAWVLSKSDDPVSPAKP